MFSGTFYEVLLAALFYHFLVNAAPRRTRILRPFRPFRPKLHSKARDFSPGFNGTESSVAGRRSRISDLLRTRRQFLGRIGARPSVSG
jgi:hypothetical protein